MDIETVARDNLKALAHAYSKATGRTVTAISKEFYGNVNVFDAFFAGDQSIRLSIYSGIIKEMIRKWPPEAEFPYLRAIIFPRPPRRGKVFPKKRAG